MYNSNTAIKIALPPPEEITVSRWAAEKLIQSGDGDAALLYIHILASGCAKTLAEMAAELGRPEDGVRAAMRKLGELGLISFDGGPPPFGADAPREERKPESPREIPMDGGFSEVARQTQLTLGKALSANDLERLYGIYSDLGFTPDMMLQLVSHCAEETKRARGENKRPTMSYIEKAAYIWRREGISTLERADEYIQGLQARRSAAGEVKKALQITERGLTPSEAKYVDAWLALGFTADAIAIAYDRTMVNTGKRTWKYMDSIINSWHGKNLHTPEEILEKDAKASDGARPKRGGGKNSSPTAQDIERMKKMIERMEQEE